MAVRGKEVSPMNYEKYSRLSSAESSKTNTLKSNKLRWFHAIDRKLLESESVTPMSYWQGLSATESPESTQKRKMYSERKTVIMKMADVARMTSPIKKINMFTAHRRSQSNKPRPRSAYYHSSTKYFFNIYFYINYD
jgi:hypothetical protein